jgi:acyl dehydratase
MHGQAMIAVHGERDLKMVRIGDEVSGIGRVTAIENSGNGWIVQGTTGQIKQ